MIDVYVDADACPVKDEIYDVAGRYGLRVFLVANASMRVPDGAAVEMIVVEEGLDAADDWIADHVRAGDLVVTGDVPLAARCLAAGARVAGPTGRAFSAESIGDALATRDLRAELRESGLDAGGPRALSPRDRSRFLSLLDQLVQAGLRGT